MQTVTTIGLDIAKSVFQVHGVDAAGQVVIRRQLKRRYILAFFQKLQPCLVGIEACASSHHWSRELQALGHSVRLMPPAYVKPYVKRQKNDANDAEAICEAVEWPGYDQADAFRLHKVINEPDFLPLHIVRLFAEAAKLVRTQRGKLMATPLGKSMLSDVRQGSLPAILFHLRSGTWISGTSDAAC